MPIISRIAPHAAACLLLALSFASALAAAGPSGPSMQGFETVPIPADAPVRLLDGAAARAGQSLAERRLHGSLARLVAARARGAEDLAGESGIAEALIEGDRVLVEIRFRPGARRAGSVEGLGGRIRHQLGADLTEAWMPIAALEALAAGEGIARVWPAMQVQTLAGSALTQGLAEGQAGPWHSGGLDGSGVTVAIIDSFNNTGGEVASLQSSGDWPGSGQLSTVKMGGGSFGANGVPHGNAVLEIAFDIAPGADFIAYDTLTKGDWIAAINDAVSQGANVISASLGMPLDGIGDGTALSGSVAEAVESAAAAGVVYLNAAANSREQHWGGLYAPSAGDADVHDWDGSGQQINYYGPDDGTGDAWCINDGATLRGELFWADWTDVDHDYELLLFEYDGSGWNQIASSTDTQDGTSGQVPQEFVSTSASTSYPGVCSASSGVYGWAVSRFSAATDVNLQFFSPIPLDERVFARSLGFPADSPSAVTVAAVDQGTSVQEPYSSEGPILAPGGGLPTGSEEPKPDVASFANVDTVSYGAGVFNGTSAATPHVAGMTALLKQLHPGMTRAELIARLEAISATGSNDLGTAGHDFQHGEGRVRFQLESALAITQQPANVAAHEAIGPVDVELRDDEGLVVLSGPTGQLDAAIGNDPSSGAATLSGTTSRALSAGLASFDDLSLDTEGAGYTLSVSSSGPGPVESDSFDVTGGVPTQLSFSVQPSDVDAGQAVSPSIVVQVLDSVGNVVTTDNSTQVQLAISAGPGGANLSGGGPVTVSSGEAVFGSVSIDLVGSGYQLEASDVGASLTPDTSAFFDVLPGDPASLAFSVQPSNADAGQAIAPAIVVQVLDSQGNLVTDDSSTQVELSIVADVDGATLSGGGPVTVSSGEATFASASIDVAATGYQLQASDSGAALGTATSTTFDIGPGAPASLAFGVQPSETQVNEAITPAITVNVLDSQGNVVTDDNSTQVELIPIAGPGSASMSGGGPVTVSSGAAVFDSVSFDTVADGYQLEASDVGASLTSDTSATFSIIPGDPVSLAFVVQPSDTILNAPMDPAVVVEVVDAGGDRVTWDNGTQIELILSGAFPGTLSGGGPVTVTDGIAEFSSLSVDLEGTDYQLEAVDSGAALTPANSTLFDIILDEVFQDRFEDIAP